MSPEELVALARAALDLRPDDPTRALADLAALRAEVDLVAIAAAERGEAALLPDLRRPPRPARPSGCRGYQYVGLFTRFRRCSGSSCQRRESSAMALAISGMPSPGRPSFSCRRRPMPRSARASRGSSAQARS